MHDQSLRMAFRMSWLFIALIAPCGDAFMHFPAVARPSAPSTRSHYSGASRPAAQVHGTLVSRNAVKEMTRRTAEAPTEEKGRAEFELNRGQAVDTLLNDYNSMYKSEPDFSIFTKDVMLRDVQGFTLEGLKSYRLFFQTVTNLMTLLFAQSSVSVVLMDKYGIDKSKIKLRWRIELSQSRFGMSSWKQVFSGMDANGDGVIDAEEFLSLSSKKTANQGKTWTKADDNHTPIVIEGISEYALDRKGRIFQHQIEIQYPSSPFSLAPLRALLPVRQPGFAGVAGFMSPSMPLGFASLAPSSSAEGTVLHAKVERSDGMLGGGFLASMLPKELRKSLPKTCKSDYDCNPGGYNFPLICQDFVVARFCIDPDDWRGGGLGASAWDQESVMAREAIPVKVTDGYGGSNGGYSGGGYGE